MAARPSLMYSRCRCRCCCRDYVMANKITRVGGLQTAAPPKLDAAVQRHRANVARARSWPKSTLRQVPNDEAHCSSAHKELSACGKVAHGFSRATVATRPEPPIKFGRINSLPARGHIFASNMNYRSFSMLLVRVGSSS